MIFEPTKIQGAFKITLDPKNDERGFLARIWDKQPFLEQGIKVEWVQAYVSQTKHEGTLRGLHYQVEPQAEAKLIRCLKGQVYEVLADTRKASASFGKWEGFEIATEDFIALYVPAGVAHGILASSDSVEILNFSSAPYTAECERGLRYNDSAFKIQWPHEPKIISAKDSSWPDFKL